MFETVRNAWKIPELRKKILFTFFILLIYRLGSAVPVPYVNIALLQTYFNQLETTVLGLYNAMSGDAFSKATLFALSVQPYINASIIINLLTVAIPALERMQKEEGEEGRKKIERITRFSTVGLALLMGFAYYMMLRSNSLLLEDATGVWPAVVIILSFTAGSAFIMWLGEQITEFGIGNGISMILFAAIISRVPSGVSTIIENFPNAISPVELAFILVGILLLIVLIIFVTNSERRIPIQYSKRLVGRKMYGGQSTHLPMKLNMSGVIPIIFAQAIASLPATLGAFFTPASGSIWEKLLSAIDTTSFLYMMVYFALIIGFSFFYTFVQFNPIEIANNLRKNGGYIPGFRPGRPTSDFLSKVLTKITFFGGLYLGVVALIPIVAGKFITVSGLAIGGTSVIIVVGVALETVKQLEAQMLMRHYKGFLE